MLTATLITLGAILAAVPFVPRFLFQRGMVLTGQGSYPAALWYFTQALSWSSGPLQRNALWNRACVQMRLGSMAAARKDFERLVALAPEFASAWQNLSNIQQHLGMYAEAYESAARLGELEPHNPYARRYLHAVQMPRRRWTQTV